MAAANEEQLKRLKEADEKEVKEKIISFFQGHISPETLVWEIVPDYFTYKLPNLRIVSVSLKTNISGDRIDFMFYVIGYIPLTSIVNISEVVDVILRSSCDKWAPTSYTTEVITQVANEHPLVKYTLPAINYSGTKLAKGNVHVLKNL